MKVKRNILGTRSVKYPFSKSGSLSSFLNFRNPLHNFILSFFLDSVFKRFFFLDNNKFDFFTSIQKIDRTYLYFPTIYFTKLKKILFYSSIKNLNCIFRSHIKFFFYLKSFRRKKLAIILKKKLLLKKNQKIKILIRQKKNLFKSFKTVSSFNKNKKIKTQSQLKKEQKKKRFKTQKRNSSKKIGRNTSFI
jgi:hypothetical protein